MVGEGLVGGGGLGVVAAVVLFAIYFAFEGFNGSIGGFVGHFLSGFLSGFFCCFVENVAQLGIGGEGQKGEAGQKENCFLFHNGVYFRFF